MASESERKGFAVTDDGCKLAYKLRGRPDARHKVIMVMGFACCQEYWAAQLRMLDNDSQGEIEMLAFDNRGTGESERPLQCYTTSQLAADAVRVMETVGWIPRVDKGYREGGIVEKALHTTAKEAHLHIVGWSLGGMIAQELGLMLMDRGTCPSSLALACSHSGGWRYVPPFTSAWTILKVATALSREGRIDRVLLLHHTEEFLNKEMEMDVASSIARGTEAKKPKKVRRGNSAKDMLAEAYQSRSPFTGSLWWNLPGLIGHFLAVTTHYVSNERLARLGGSSGPRCLVISAGKDSLMDHRHAHDLAVALRGGSELYEFSTNGHMVNVERHEEFNSILLNHFHRSARPDSKDGQVDEIDNGMGRLRKQLINADCRRYKSIELRDDRWENRFEVSVKRIMGWTLRFSVFLPLMIFSRACTNAALGCRRIVFFICSCIPIDWNNTLGMLLRAGSQLKRTALRLQELCLGADKKLREICKILWRAVAHSIPSKYKVRLESLVTA